MQKLSRVYANTSWTHTHTHIHTLMITQHSLSHTRSHTRSHTVTHMIYYLSKRKEFAQRIRYMQRCVCKINLINKDTYLLGLAQQFGWANLLLVTVGLWLFENETSERRIYTKMQPLLAALLMQAIHRTYTCWGSHLSCQGRTDDLRRFSARK